MTKIYIGFSDEEVKENQVSEMLAYGDGLFYGSLDDLLENETEDNINSVFVVEIVDAGVIENTARFVSNKKKEAGKSKSK